MGNVIRTDGLSWGVGGWKCNFLQYKVLAMSFRPVPLPPPQRFIVRTAKNHWIKRLLIKQYGDKSVRQPGKTNSHALRRWPYCGGKDQGAREGRSVRKLSEGQHFAASEWHVKVAIPDTGFERKKKSHCSGNKAHSHLVRRAEKLNYLCLR